jgi:hypothetical protein
MRVRRFAFGQFEILKVIAKNLSMGLALEFYLGDTERIISAVKNIEFQVLYDPTVVEKRADFSLHIVPKDLELLSYCISRRTGTPPMKLREHLVVLLEERDRGVLEVGNSWIEYAAAVQETQLPQLSSDWVDAMSYEHREHVVQSDELVRAVRDLIAMCKNAAETEHKLLHVWFK